MRACNCGHCGVAAAPSFARRRAQVREVLESETHVDMDKLLSLCQHGLPAVLRGEAWMYLLGVSPPEKSEEMSLGKRMGQEFAELERALLPQSSELTRCVKGEVKRRRARAPQAASRDAKTRQRLERLLRCYMHGHGDEFRPGMVHLLSPLVHVYATDVEAYFCFQELMRRLERAPTFEGCKQMAVTFMTLLRHTLPDLYFYFEEEQCSGGPWLFSWLQFLLARELPLPCVLRLWDRLTRPPPRTAPTQWRRCTHAPGQHGAQYAAQMPRKCPASCLPVVLPTSGLARVVAAISHYHSRARCRCRHHWPESEGCLCSCAWPAKHDVRGPRRRSCIFTCAWPSSRRAMRSSWSSTMQRSSGTCSTSHIWIWVRCSRRRSTSRMT